jgi:5'-3' exonuclease
MGVPGFVAWLYHNHANANFIFKQLFKSNNIDNINDLRIESVQHLLIDANCLIHPQAREIYLANMHLVDTNLDLLEKKIINQVITYIELLITNTKPTDSIFIAVDGVAPMAKIKHQRLRRFKAVYDKKILEIIAKNHNKPIQKEWNTSAITPGTIFMDKLMKQLLLWVKTNNHGCKVILSSSYTTGEGEHKLLQYLKKINLNKSDNTVIYGLDADLLFLSLASAKNNLFLMRETSQMEMNKHNARDIPGDGFSYLSIDRLKYVIGLEMSSRLKIELNIENIINDFVFLCYFCGNDFIPNIPSLTIKPHNKKIINGIDTIIEAYASIISETNNEFLINIKTDLNNHLQTTHININRTMLIKILDIISEQENAYYNDHYRHRRFFRRCDSNDPYDIDVHNFNDNIIYKPYDPIQLGNPSTNLHQWKRNYYKTLFNIDIDTSNNKDKSLNYLMENYIKGLVWTTYYYYDKCKDYEWFFPYHHGPFVSDLNTYIKSNPNVLEHFENLYSYNSAWFENEIKPLQQLMLVLPYDSSYLLPPSYRTALFGKKLLEYFPKKIEDMQIDYLYKSKGWQNIPMIEIIPAEIILKLTSKVKLNEEAERNKLCNEYIKL